MLTFQFLTFSQVLLGLAVLTKIGSKHSLGKEIQVFVQMKGHTFFQGEITKVLTNK